MTCIIVWSKTIVCASARLATVTKVSSRAYAVRLMMDVSTASAAPRPRTSIITSLPSLLECIRYLALVLALPQSLIWKGQTFPCSPRCSTRWMRLRHWLLDGRIWHLEARPNASRVIRDVRAGVWRDAARAPMCSREESQARVRADRYADSRARIHRVEHDDIVRMRGSEAIYRALACARASDLRFTRCPKFAHDLWTAAYGYIELRCWMFRMSRPLPDESLLDATGRHIPEPSIRLRLPCNVMCCTC
jgi:hypothetical protein